MRNDRRRLTEQQKRVLERYGMPKRRRWRLSEQGKDILMSWFIIACLFFLLGFLMGAVVIELDGAAVRTTIPAASRPSRPLYAISAIQPPQEHETIYREGDM